MLRTAVTLAVLALVQTSLYDEIDPEVFYEIFGDRNGSSTIRAPVNKPIQTTPPYNEIDPALINEIFRNIKKNLTTVAPATTPTTEIGRYEKCETRDGIVGECVPYYLCDSAGKAKTDGVDLIDIRVNNDDCPSYLETCCIMTDVREAPIISAPNTTSERQGCGWRNPDGIGFRIMGDIENESKFGEFPWMVAILKMETKYVGGGCLIHPSAVLTAAHYVANSSIETLRARAGEWDTQTKREIYPHQDRDVASVVVHQDFNKRNLFYDIAILFLASPVDLAPNVGVVCLPPPSPTGRVSGGVKCLASGWGKDKFGKVGRYQVILKKVEVPVVEHRQCQTALRKTRLGRLFMFHTSFMCAGGERGKDTCKGDGGSPLVCPIEFEKDRYMQSGIVAWGIGCGDDGTPGVYVDVSHLRDWIDDKIAGEGLDTKVYTI